MFPGFYIPTASVKIWLEKRNPESVLGVCGELCLAAAGGPSARACWLPNKQRCSAVSSTGITENGTGSSFRWEMSFN